MDPETVLNLLDSYWYELNFFNTKAKPNPKPVTERSRYNSLTLTKVSSQSNPPTLPTILTKSSISHQRSDSVSPNSVLFHPNLQTIFSGKDSTGVESEFQEIPIIPSKDSSSLRRKKKGSSKSLSDLEYQELKGFMDLGFVFSEEDKDSNLGSIIPGLHRLGQQSEGNIEIGNFVEGKNGNFPRPYLSESWHVMGKKIRVENSLMNWKVPNSVSNSEIDMKDYLRFWAHSVASSFR